MLLAVKTVKSDWCVSIRLLLVNSPWSIVSKMSIVCLFRHGLKSRTRSPRNDSGFLILYLRIEKVLAYL